MSSTRSSAILWSVIAAAFVGPGTVATAARAGSEGGLSYVLPLIGALLVGYLLMEMAARVTLVTGKPLGYAIRQSLGNYVPYFLFGGILLGCCAYEAGNLLGGFAGIELFTDLSRWWVLLPALIAGGILLSGSVKKISSALTVVVVLMGAAFLYAGISALFSEPVIARQNTSITTPTILAIFGTTIVPYNFMLAAGLGPGQSLKAMRFGLGASFFVGGLITLGILLTGTVLDQFNSFGQLGDALSQQIGNAGNVLLGVGLFAAGFSSAVTAPLAAAMAGKTMFQTAENEADWTLTSPRFKGIWILVLGVGIIVAVLGLSIVPVILAAQFINALLLPFLAALVLILGNKRELLGTEVNKLWQNLGGLLVFAYLTNKSCQGLLNMAGVEKMDWLTIAITVLLTLALGVTIFRNNKR